MGGVSIRGRLILSVLGEIPLSRALVGELIPGDVLIGQLGVSHGVCQSSTVLVVRSVTETHRGGGAGNVPTAAYGHPPMEVNIGLGDGSNSGSPRPSRSTEILRKPKVSSQSQSETGSGSPNSAC